MARTKPVAPLGSPDEIEQQFYEALQRGDIERLMATWSDDEDISCVHPGGPRVVGAVAIRAAFEAIFANSAGQIVCALPPISQRGARYCCIVQCRVEAASMMSCTSRGEPGLAW